MADQSGRDKARGDRIRRRRTQLGLTRPGLADARDIRGWAVLGGTDEATIAAWEAGGPLTPTELKHLGAALRVSGRWIETGSEDIGTRLALARLNYPREDGGTGISQTTLARKAGVSQQTIYTWEAGKGSAYPEMLFQAVDAFPEPVEVAPGERVDVTMEWLVTGEQDPARDDPRLAHARRRRDAASPVLKGHDITELLAETVHEVRGSDGTVNLTRLMRSLGKVREEVRALQDRRSADRRMADQEPPVTLHELRGDVQELKARVAEQTEQIDVVIQTLAGLRRELADEARRDKDAQPKPAPRAKKNPPAAS